ncbi:MAG: hypothetical protein AAF824_18740 [Bacteroidota bacterium]
MKKIKRGLIITLLGATLLLGGTILLILSPSCFYQHATPYKQLVILHNQALAPELFSIIDTSLAVLAQSELHDPSLSFYWCLADGGVYADLIETLLGPDTFRAFSRIIVSQGAFESSVDLFRKFDQSLSTRQFLTHALVHNLQFAHHGFWDANPLGGHPKWKWEGYAEYISLVQKPDLTTLFAISADEKETYHWISLENGQKTIYKHIPFLAATQFCLEEKHMKYEDFMRDTVSLEGVLAEISSFQP